MVEFNGRKIPVFDVLLANSFIEYYLIL